MHFGAWVLLPLQDAVPGVAAVLEGAAHKCVLLLAVYAGAIICL